MSLMSNFREFSKGRINEAALAEASVTDDDIEVYLNDEAFMQECTAACLPTILQGMLMDETADQLDESVQNAFVTVQSYLIGQGLMSEAAAVSISNPKINVVRLNKQAQIARLRTILTLKMGRKANSKAYKKYKLGQKIKKTNMEEMKKLYGAKADRLAKKLWARTRKSSKVAAVVDSNKQHAKK